MADSLASARKCGNAALGSASWVSLAPAAKNSGSR
jgi:hypothetical protein